MEKMSCRLAEIREQLMSIIDEMVKKRTFDQTSDFTIGDPDNNEKLSLVLRKDNLHNVTTAIILFENTKLEIMSKTETLDFQINLKLGNTNHINIHNLELLLVSSPILQEYSENNINKEIIACWNDGLNNSE